VKTPEAVLLAITALASVAFLVRSLLTGEDIPSGWGLLLGSLWGALIGVESLTKLQKKNAEKKGGEEE